MNKEQAIQYLKAHSMQCGYDAHGVWVIAHYGFGRNGETFPSEIHVLSTFKEIRDWLGY